LQRVGSLRLCEAGVASLLGEGGRELWRLLRADFRDALPESADLKLLYQARRQGGAGSHPGKSDSE
jgi:hypothetical protein